MPYGGNDWLALTQEPTLEPEIPICDPHHHFWDFRSERIPYQRYLLHELAADVNCGHNVRSTVFIEARSMYGPDGPAELRPVGEVEFVQGLAAASATGLYGPCRAAAAVGSYCCAASRWKNGRPPTARRPTGASARISAAFDHRMPKDTCSVMSTTWGRASARRTPICAVMQPLNARIFTLIAAMWSHYCACGRRSREGFRRSSAR